MRGALSSLFTRVGQVCLHRYTCIRIIRDDRFSQTSAVSCRYAAHAQTKSTSSPQDSGQQSALNILMLL